MGCLLNIVAYRTRNRISFQKYRFSVTTATHKESCKNAAFGSLCYLMRNCFSTNAHQVDLHQNTLIRF